MSSQNDPYSLFSDELQRTLDKVNGLYRRWSELSVTVRKMDLTMTSSSSSSRRSSGGNDVRMELNWICSELGDALHVFDADVRELERVVNMIQNNPSRFYVDPNEMENRRAFLERCRTRLELVRRNFTGQSSTPAPLAKEKEPMMYQHDYEDSPPPPAPYVMSRFDNHQQQRSELFDGRTAGRNDHQRIDVDSDQFSNSAEFMEAHRSQQMMVLNQQNDELDQLDRVVGSVHHMSIGIRDKLVEHERLLGDAESEVDRTNTRLADSMRKLKSVLNSSEHKGQYCTIVILGIILTVIIVLLVKL